MKTIAIITARGGSKRIPKKNIKDFCGKPILVYSIEAAIKSKCFDEIMVSTDDKEIARIAVENGANVPFYRSETTSSDYATTDDVLFEVLCEYKKRGMIFDYHCCIYPTAPFIEPKYLREAYEIIQATGAEEVGPYAKYGVPPQWRASISENGAVEYQEIDKLKERSQDLVPMFFDAGMFYFYDTESYIRNNGKSSVNKRRAIIVPELEVQDIDTYDDWKMAEIKYDMLRKRGEK